MMGRIVTLQERKDLEAGRRAEAAGKVMTKLRDYAASHGGRFVVFGSAARGAMRHDSDIDIWADFPLEGELGAVSFAEDVCALEGLPCDILFCGTPKAAFKDLIRDDMVVLQ
ncbi:MAG: nucleotidyltransferase domain-containing protein [Boseongicola sp.]|nr:nucleotidyltransferase domain-containing protein [Boseongicola sp.]